MAKLSSINKNNRRRKMSDRFYAKRKKLKQPTTKKNKKPKITPTPHSQSPEIPTATPQTYPHPSTHPKPLSLHHYTPHVKLP